MTANAVITNVAAGDSPEVAGVGQRDRRHHAVAERDDDVGAHQHQTSLGSSGLADEVVVVTR